MSENPIIKLADEALACGVCGVEAGPEGAERGGTETVRSLGRVSRVAALMRLPEDSPSRARELREAEFTVKMTRCAECLDRRREAEELLRDFPSARGPFPQDSVAVPRFEAALIVLAAIGEHVELTTARDVSRLVTALVDLAHGLTWSARFVPTAADDVKVDECASRPFAHLTERQLGAARAALLAWRVRRVERPIGLLPPVGDGCFLCGVGTVTMRPSRRSEAWHQVTIRVGNFHGSSDEKRDVALCITCHGARREGEALGTALVDRLVKRVSGVAMMLGGDRVTTDALPWGLSGRAKPNTERWAHIDLEDLRRQVRTTAWIGK